MSGEDLPKMAGIVVQQHLEAFAELYGKDTLDQALAALDEADRGELTMVVAPGWVSMPALESFYEVSAGLVGRTAAQVHASASGRAMEKRLRTLWKIILRFTSDEALVQRTGMLFSKTYSRGRLTTESIGGGRATVRLSGWPDAPDLVVRGVKVGIGVVLRAAGRRHVEATATRTPDGALFEARWR